MERIKWKSIKPGLVIGCRNEKETIMLLEYLEELGYKWLGGQRPMKNANSRHFCFIWICGDNRLQATTAYNGNIMLSDLVEKEEIRPRVAAKYFFDLLTGDNECAKIQTDEGSACPSSAYF